MRCPYCGDNLLDGNTVCPSCGMEIRPDYDNIDYNDYENDNFENYDPPPPPEEDFYGNNQSNKTAIVALDPEFNKETRIVSNPLLEDASLKKAKRRRSQPKEEQKTEDDITYLMSLFKYIYVRLNFFEKISFWMFVVATFFSFAPWSQNLKFGTLISGFELEGFYVAILTGITAFLILIKIGMRFGFWMSLLYLASGFSGTALMIYLIQRGALPGQQYLVSFHITLFASGFGFIALFVGSMRRFLQ